MDEPAPEEPNGNARSLRKILEARFDAKKHELVEIRRQINDVQKKCRHIGMIHDCTDCGAQDV